MMEQVVPEESVVGFAERFRVETLGVAGRLEPAPELDLATMAQRATLVAFDGCQKALTDLRAQRDAINDRIRTLVEQEAVLRAAVALFVKRDKRKAGK